MHLDLIYTSAACNSNVNACDWGQNNLICYASCNSVIIYNPKYSGTNKDLKILTLHTDKVCVVKWIKNKEGVHETELISTSNDGTAVIWSLQNNEYHPFVLQGHSDGVNRVDSICTNLETYSLIVATGSIDSTVKIWKREVYGGEFTNIQTLNLNRGLCVGLCLAFLPNTKNIIMACGRDTSKIELYVQDDFSEDFKIVDSFKGHENWVPGLDFAVDDKEDLILASSSQDKFIRIWRITKMETKEEMDTTDSQFKFKYDLNSINTKFDVKTRNGSQQYMTRLESVLCGHEGWVYEVRWAPRILKEDGSYTQPMKLASCSLDKTIVIWTLQETAGVWIDSVRVGEVGGNTLGFYGCKFSPDGLSIIGHGYLGSFHLWNYNTESDCWEPDLSPRGHSNQVVDMSWEPEGEYVMSVSLDQTTRIHAPWVREDTISWHEIARPQVHGYDMSCLAILSRYRFASGAEEKIVRIFEAPFNFVENFHYLSSISDDKDSDYIANAISGPRGASVPSLGLSNKAIYESSNEDQAKPVGKEIYPEETYFHEIQLEAPPMEEDLLQNTLWPEVQKLYGHGYEVYAIASSHDAKILATSCKATTSSHASIILWDAENWQQSQKLLSHTLTVTQLAFSPDDNKLLSVSRDRRLSVFERNTETGEFFLAATTDKRTGIHTRIIWCCAWSHDSKYFITGSRDGKVVIWTKNENKKDINSPLKYYEAVGCTLELKEHSVTAVAFAPVFVDDSYLVCLGFETGEMKILKWNKIDSWQQCIYINKSTAHHKTVKRIQFRPLEGQAGIRKKEENILQLASCGADHSVKIYNLYFKE